jgi:formylglycine-generating enzyme required for sulfatase activity
MPVEGSPRTSQQILDALAESQPNRKLFELPGGLRFWMMEIPAGEYWIGSRVRALEREMPRHKVNLVEPFYLGQIPVTVGLWQAVQPQAERHTHQDDPAFWEPKTWVSWWDVMGKRAMPGWLHQLAERVAPLSGYNWHLPTEAEWELACRASSLSKYWNGEDEAALAAVGWYVDNSRNRLRSVADFPTAEAKTHPYGLLHMHGLVDEWCEDPADEQAYIKKPPNDINVAIPKEKDPDRVFRGGSRGFTAVRCRSSDRIFRRPDFRSADPGFRLCLSPRP